MLDIAKKVILNSRLFIFLAFFVFFKPLSFYYYDFLNKICNILMLVLIGIIDILYIKQCIKNKKISKIQIYIMGYVLILLLSTIMGTKDFNFFIKVYMKWISISFYTEMLIKNNLNLYLKTFSNFIFSITVINFFSIIIFPNGVIQPNGVSIYFLGNDNTSTINLVLGALFILLKDYYLYRRMTPISIIDIIMVTVSYIITWSATGLVGVAIMLLFILCLYKKNKLNKIFNAKTYLIIAIFAFIAIVIFRLQNYFEYIIVGVLKKDLTFSQRTFIWDNCLNYIQKKPIFGLGVQEFSARLEKIGIYHAHCTLLNVLLEGGVLGLIFYLNIFVQIIKRLNKYKSSEICNILSIGICIYFICGIVEVFQDSQMLYIFIVLSYYIKYFMSERIGGNNK